MTFSIYSEYEKEEHNLSEFTKQGLCRRTMIRMVSPIVLASRILACEIYCGHFTLKYSRIALPLVPDVSTPITTTMVSR